MNAAKPMKVEADALADIRTMSASDQPDVLTDIYQDFHNIVIWRRNLSSSLLVAVNDLLKSGQPVQVTRTVSSQSVLVEMREALQGFDGVDELTEDIAELVDMFCTLFDLKYAGLRLTALDSSMCPRFHEDNVPCRLVTTYQGSCTQWLRHESVDRTKLGRGNGGLPDELSGVYKSAEDIQQLNNGDVALLKGKQWQGNEHAGLVHRSPTLDVAERRLLFTLDFSS